MTNEAAERLRSQINGWITNGGAHAHAVANLSDALAAERKATVERIRAALIGVGAFPDVDITASGMDSINAILDAEAAR